MRRGTVAVLGAALMAGAVNAGGQEEGAPGGEYANPLDAWIYVYDPGEGSLEASHPCEAAGCGAETQSVGDAGSCQYLAGTDWRTNGVYTGQTGCAKFESLRFPNGTWRVTWREDVREVSDARYDGVMKYTVQDAQGRALATAEAAEAICASIAGLVAACQGGPRQAWVAPPDPSAAALCGTNTLLKGGLPYKTMGSPICG